MKYIYCLTKGETEPVSLPPGIDSMPVNKISFGAMAALASDIKRAAPPKGVENALMHHEVVNKALGCFSAVIPCRFGVVLRNEAAVVSLLEKHYGALQAHLDKFKGKLEVGIKAIIDAAISEDELKAETILSRTGALACPGRVLTAQDELKAETISNDRPRPGVRYLLEKMAQCRRFDELKELAEKISMALKEATAPCWEEARAENRPLSDGLMLDLCFLIEGAELTRFKLQYERFRKEYSGIHFLYTGPWPPYSFADFDLSKWSGDGQ